LPLEPTLLFVFVFVLLLRRSKSRELFLRSRRRMLDSDSSEGQEDSSSKTKIMPLISSRSLLVRLIVVPIVLLFVGLFELFKSLFRIFGCGCCCCCCCGCCGSSGILISPIRVMVPASLEDGTSSNMGSIVRWWSFLFDVDFNRRCEELFF